MQQRTAYRASGWDHKAAGWICPGSNRGRGLVQDKSAIADVMMTVMKTITTKTHDAQE
jgi:hypothetical protein